MSRFHPVLRPTGDLLSPSANECPPIRLAANPRTVPKYRRVLLTSLLLLAAPWPLATHAQVERNPVRVTGVAESAGTARVIVKFRADSTVLRKHALSAIAGQTAVIDAVTARANSLGMRVGLSLGAGRAISDRTQVVTATGIDARALAARLAAEPDIEYAVEDHRRAHFATPNDPLYSVGPAVSGSSGGPATGQWYLRAPAGQVLSSINAPGAWDITTGSSGIVVAVLDSGVRPEHPELAGRLLPGYEMISDPLMGNDDNGRDANPSDPGDWVTAAESSNAAGPFYQCGASESSWHGTKTTSLVGAAANDGVGMTGVAWGVGLLPVRVLGKCGGYDSDIIAGMNWAAGLSVPGIPVNPNPARVINMSLGSAGACTQSYIDAIGVITGKASPAVIVMAAGNSLGHAVGTPANCPGVIAVSGLRHVGTKVGFSDLGPEISISAPAGNCVNTDPALPCLYPILAATNTGLTGPVASTYTDSFNASVGTSFSSPLVAGTVALMLSVNPALTPAEIKMRLQRSARAFPWSSSPTDPVPSCQAPTATDQLECNCTTTTCGAGMLDVTAAVRSAIPETAARIPVNGWWWNPNESGRGFSIEVSGTNLFMAAFLYDPSGRAVWYVTAGPLKADGSYSGQMQEYAGGQALTGAYQPAIFKNNATSVELLCSTPTACNLTWAGGTVPIQRYVFDGTATPSTAPQTGWWWNAAESGRGYFIEVQGSSLFAAGYMYDVSGNALWYLASGPTLATSFTGQWSQYANGQTLLGSYHAASVVNGSVGAAVINFRDSANATLTLPDGRQVPLTRFRF